jgi:predicted kinase
VKAPLVIVSGPPGAGKTTLARRLSEELSLPLITKDDIKETIFDSLGYSDREWSKRVGAATWDLIFLLIERTSSTTVIVESNFYPELQREKVAAFGRPVIEVHCIAEPVVLSERFHTRERHPGHTREEPYTPADAARALVFNGALAIGRVIEVDTTLPDKIDWDQLIKELGEIRGPENG